MEEKFRYVNVLRVATFIFNDIFDSTSECLSGLLCSSVSISASKGANVELWCVLSIKVRKVHDLVNIKYEIYFIPFISSVSLLYIYSEDNVRS